MKTFRYLAGLAGALALLGACATATPYKPALDGNYGYQTQQIETDRWKVMFSGNSLTDRQTVETYLIYRAAELTDQQGYDWFKTVQRATDEDKRVVSTGFGPDPFYSRFYSRYRFYTRSGHIYYAPGYHWGRPFGPYCDPFYDIFCDNHFEMREIVRYEADAEIIMGKGETPDGEDYFTADEVLANLASSIVRPQPVS